MSDFKPVLYFKASCPFCLKVAAFFCEAGLFDMFDIRAFWPSDEHEQAIRDELEPHFETVSFPTLQYAPGQFMNGSEAIIEHYAKQHAIDPPAMPFYAYILSGPMRRMREQFAEIRELKQGLDRMA